MTLNYHKEIMTSHPWTFFKLLWNWRASVWKAVAVELLVWLIIYAIISVVYRTALAQWQMREFENVVMYFESHLSYIPLDLLLGFYIRLNVDRWTYRYRRIGFIDNVCLMVAEYVRGHNEIGRQFRRTIIRYCSLGQIMVFRDISMRVRRRFPTLDSLVAAGFMTEPEKKEFESYNLHYKQWICFNWAYALVYEARKKGLIKSDLYVNEVVNQIRTFRTDLETCNNYDWTPIPLLYSHVVCLAVHFYFMVALIARQHIISEDSPRRIQVDMYFPLMPTLQFIFYMGWLKIAETMINPFGEDDDDWETNALIDRNITMGMAIVDPGFDRPPELRKDPFWDDVVVEPLYSENSTQDNGDGERGMRGSASMAILHTGRETHMMPHINNNHLHANGYCFKDIVVPIIQIDKAPMPKRPSLLSLDGLRNIRKLTQKTSHYVFNPNGAGVASLKAENGTVVGKAMHPGVKDEIDNRTAYANEEDGEADTPGITFITLEEAMKQHLPPPSVPIEVPAPPVMLDDLALPPGRCRFLDADGHPLENIEIDFNPLNETAHNKKLPKGYDLPRFPL